MYVRIFIRIMVYYMLYESLTNHYSVPCVDWPLDRWDIKDPHWPINTQHGTEPE